jgi:enterochelin esterase-like enzyme
MRRAPVAVALALAVPALTGATSASGAAWSPPGWSRLQGGTRGGALYASARRGGPALYLPPHAAAGGRYRAVVVLVPRTSDPVALARDLRLAAAGDQLIWDGTTAPFAALVASARQLRPGLEQAFSSRGLPVAQARPVVAGVGDGAAAALRLALRARGRVAEVAALDLPGSPPSGLVGGSVRGVYIASPAGDASARRRALGLAAQLSSLSLPHRVAFVAGSSTTAREHGELLRALPYLLQPRRVRRAAGVAGAVAPPGWRQIVAGPAGGTVWQGSIPDTVLAGDTRSSLVYLPPSVRGAAHYPLVVLLHGLRGSPYSFVGGLRLAAVADSLIAAHRVPPFVAVMPPAGLTPSYDGEWTGPWERYVLRDVLPWARAHLPLSSSSRTRSIAGFSAGGYGAVDIALRHPGLFRTAESWSGYFTAPRDGALAGASASVRRANDPTLLLAAEAARLRALGTRFYLSAGLRDRGSLVPTRRFAGALARLRLPHSLVLAPGGHRGGFWRTTLESALIYALRGG